MTTTVQDKAAEALTWFEVARRDENDPESTFVRTKEGTPEWVTQLVYAHGDFLPDDWRYRKIMDALEFIADSDDPEDNSGEFADTAVDIYTSDRLAWLASNLNRIGYTDEAVSEFGAGEPMDIVTMIGWGQYAESEEIYQAVLAAL